MPKNVFIPWSGGLDSTYLLYRTLTEGDIAWGAYVDILNERNDEKIALANLATIFQSRFGKAFKNLGVQASVQMVGANPHITMSKAPVVFPLLVHAVHYEIDEVAIAFNADDKFRGPEMEGYELKVQALWESCRAMDRHAKWRVVYPLLHIPKAEVTARLPEEYRRLCCSSPQRLVNLS